VVAPDALGEYSARRLPPNPIGRSGRMNTRLMGYCTVKGLGATVLALPSRPSPHTYQLPADDGAER